MQGHFPQKIIFFYHGATALVAKASSLSYAGLSFSDIFFYGPTALVAKVSSLSRIHDHFQLNTVQFSPKIMGQSVVFLVLWKILIKS